MGREGRRLVFAEYLHHAGESGDDPECPFPGKKGRGIEKRTMTRKEFITRVGALFGALSVSSVSTASAATVSKTGKRQTEALKRVTEDRHKARWRFRRIILNNDGNDVILSDGEIVSREMFLAKRTTGLVGSQVDTVCYCTGITFGGHHRGKNQLIQRRFGMARCSQELSRLGTDPLQLMVDFCHQHGIELFWSHRMNDMHDASPTPELMTDFKKAHPEYLMGGKKAAMCYDYAVPQVREKFLECCEEVIRNYDVDGIELDWFRHLFVFKSVVGGGVASDEEREMIHDMMRKLRALMDQEGLRRKRPLLLAVRVPDSRAYSRQVGLDYEQWLKEDLVDLLIVNDYIKLEPWANFPRFASQYDVPAYASMESRRLSLMDVAPGTMTNPEGGGETVNARFRSEAYSAWLSGMNGIHTYNRFDPQDEILRQIGDPRVLAGMGVVPRESYGLAKSWSGMHYCNVNYWLKGGEKYLQIPAEQKYVRPAGPSWPDSDSERDSNP